MASSAGLRFPKPHVFASGSQFGNTVDEIGGETFVSAGAAYGAFLAPARYSEVRKVVFSVAVRLNNASGSEVPWQLRVHPSSTSAAQRTIDVVTIEQGDAVFGDQNQGPWDAAGEQALDVVCYAKKGDAVTIPRNTANLDVKILQVEFDRFEPDSADFFADWDQVAAAGDRDAYVEFCPVLWTPQGSLTASGFEFLTVQCTVVQAPSTNNRTSTFVNMNLGWRRGSGGQVAYLADDDLGRFQFPFEAAQWDGIVAANLFFRVHNNQNSTGVSIKLAKRDNDTATVTQLEEWTFPTATLNRMYYGRSDDILPHLVDGVCLVADYKHDAAPQSMNANGTQLSLCLEIIQEGFSKTCSWWDVPGMNDTVTDTVATGRWTALFDPTWFANLRDDQILARRVVLALDHNTQANNPQQALCIDANLQATHASLGSPTLFTIAPHLNETPSSETRIKFRNSAIVNNDPIDLAGQRKLVWGALANSVWSSGTDDTPGMEALYYALLVPNAEFPEEGPLFDLGPVAAEGCAATAAGGGDPGVLVITNGATLPQKFDPVSGEIQDAGIPTPFPEETPSSTTDSAATGLGLGTYVYRYTFRNSCTGKESDPNPEDIAVDTSGESPAAEVTLSFAGVRIPGDEQIDQIVVYRTIVGGEFPTLARVGTMDLATETQFVDAVPDADLDFDDEPLSILNGPMPCCPIVVGFKNKLFAMGDIPDLTPAGTVAVVNGSTDVVGDGDVEWTRCLEGKLLQVEGDCRKYEIARVLPPVAGESPPLGRLRLTEEYEGTTRQGLTYTICGRPNRLYESEPYEPEYWPAANIIDIEPGDGDRLMGAFANFDRLVICKRRKTYVLAFAEAAASEGRVPQRVSSDIGCIAPRSFAQAENGTIWLADRGLALFDGRGVQHVPESVAVNDIFTDPDNLRYVRRDATGRVIEAVGVYYARREQYLLLLPTVGTQRGCNLMLVWNTKLRNITLLEFCQEFLSMCVAKDAQGTDRVYLGDANGFVWVYDIGHTDGAGIPGLTGTVQGTMTNAGIDEEGASFFDDDSASFIMGGLPSLSGLSGVSGLSPFLDEEDLGLAGVCLFFREDEDDEWRSRTIYASSETRVYVTPSWGNERPGPGWQYMIGPIRFEALFKPRNYNTDDTQKRNWRQVVTHEVEAMASELRVELLPDLTDSDPEEDTVLGDDGEVSRRTFDLSFERGRQIRPVGRGIHNFMAVRLSNFAPDQPVRILNHALGVERGG